MSNLGDEIKKLREDFTKGQLSKLDVDANPALQFEAWLQEALNSNVSEVQGVTLSTVSPDGKPAARVVYLREFQNNQFWFYGNYNSRKGRHIANNPNIALSFFWPDLQRQIRIEGTAAKCADSFSDDYFNSRPRESQIGSWASEQSELLKTRKNLEDRVKYYTEKFEGKTIPRPEFWGGWVMKANYYEFWQGRKSRLHDRIIYTFEKDNWNIERLAP